MSAQPLPMAGQAPADPEAVEAMKAEVRELAAEREAVILAHNYQVPEVQDVADFVGESDHRALPGNSEYHPRRALRVLLQHLRFEVITLTEPRPDRKAFAGAEKAPPDLGFAGRTEQ